MLDLTLVIVHCAVAVFVAYFGFVPDTGPLHRKPIGSNPPKYSKQVIG